MKITHQLVGENGVIIYLPAPTQLNYPSLLKGLVIGLKNSFGINIIELIPAYRSLLIEFNDNKISLEILIEFTNNYINQENILNKSKYKLHKIPVCYDEIFSPDLINISNTNNIAIKDIISLHTKNSYDVYAIGFIPGFPFLGYVDKRISINRHNKPRTTVATGSVGIAGNQTGIYPIESPGGWQIIGRTPVKLFSPSEGIFSLFQIGDKVQFYKISLKEYEVYNKK